MPAPASAIAAATRNAVCIPLTNVLVLAEREGVDPATDRRPWVLAAMVGALPFLANRDWQAGGDRSPEAMSAAFDAYAVEVTSALTGHWDPPGKARVPAGYGRIPPADPSLRGIHVKAQIWHVLANPAI
jgi:hypothetical protein